MSDECSNMQVINDWFRDNFKYQTLAYDHNIAMVRILVASLRERSLDAPRDWVRDIKDDFKFQSAALDQKKAKRLISFNKACRGIISSTPFGRNSFCCSPKKREHPVSLVFLWRGLPLLSLSLPLSLWKEWMQVVSLVSFHYL